MAMARQLRKAGRKPGEFVEDDGYQYAPACQSCPWRDCVWTLTPADRHIFQLAYRTLAVFKAKPETVIST